MARNDGKGVSLAKGPIGIVGIILLAAAIIWFVSGADTFPTDKIGDKDLSGKDAGKKVLGIKMNGWTVLLVGVSGLLLLLSAPLHWAGKSIGLIIGLVLGAASVILLFDKKDVFGLFGGDPKTSLVLGIASAVLLVFSLLPRVGKGDDDDVHHDDRGAVRTT